MGHCYLMRRGGAGKRLPVLNTAYPADVTMWGDGGNATFRVVIAEAGIPSDYTYEWYRNGERISGVNGAVCTLTGLMQAGTESIYCVVTNGAGSVVSRTASLTVKNPAVTYTYTGEHEKIDDGNGNWRIKLKSSGILTFTNLGKWDGKLDVFCVGGGSSNPYNMGGSGGNTLTAATTVAVGTAYEVQIGAGGTNRGKGGDTTFGTFKALGGDPAGGTGSGGGGTSSTNAGAGGTDGGAGLLGGRQGQGTTTREFGETDGDLYSGGGGGASSSNNFHAEGGAGGGAKAGTAAADNTGGGAGGSEFGVAWTGGSGIVVVRNHREVAA